MLTGQCRQYKNIGAITNKIYLNQYKKRKLSLIFNLGLYAYRYLDGEKFSTVAIVYKL